jgi:hypothetical protein
MKVESKRKINEEGKGEKLSSKRTERKNTEKLINRKEGRKEVTFFFPSSSCPSNVK